MVVIVTGYFTFLGNWNGGGFLEAYGDTRLLDVHCWFLDALFLLLLSPMTRKVGMTS